jgi:hypothetical protein
MQVVYLNEKTEFGTLGLWEMKNQNKYGTMYGMAHKLDLVTTEYVGDYYIFRSLENNKVFLSIDGSCQIGTALGKIQASVTKEKGFNFKVAKDRIYIRLTEQQALQIPKFHNLMVSVNVYGVFLQSVTGLAFVQCELSGFKALSRQNFDASDDNSTHQNFDASDDNSVFP